MSDFLKDNWLLLLPPVLGFGAVYLLLPRARRSKPLWGVVAAALALALGAILLVRTDTYPVESLLFYAFSGLAIGAGVMMITQANPVHAALSFALVVLASCGLFLLQAAPFLMAATIIVYAGAIVVTFLFVIMLAQQEGPSSADQRTREPFLASLAGCILLVSLVCLLHQAYRAPAEEQTAIDEITRELTALRDVKTEADVSRLLGDRKTVKVGATTRPLVEKIQKMFPGGRIKLESDNLQQAWVKMDVNAVREKSTALYHAIGGRGAVSLGDVPGKKTTPGLLPASNVAALGRTLFTDYLVAVELAAVLLLVATIGAIVIAGRRSEELR